MEMAAGAFQECVTVSCDRPITLTDLIRVARGNAMVSVSEDVYARLQASREVVNRHLGDSTQSVYGLNTGLGSLKDVRMSTTELEAFNRGVIIEHAVAVGPEAPDDVVRAAMVARVVALARGGSGISTDTFQRLVDCLNTGVTPVVHTLGSVGEADLGSLAQIALVMIGEGEAQYQGRRVKTAQLFTELGWGGLVLQPRDALALIGTNSFAAGMAGLAVADLKFDLALAEAIGALSLAAYRANSTALDDRVVSQRGHEAAAVASRLRTFLQGTSYTPRSIQDPLSYRCIPQVYGGLAGAVERAEATVLREITMSLDNPLVVLEARQMVSNGNFDPTELALDVDTLRNAVYRVCVMIERRTGKLLDSRFSGLPTGLAQKAGHSGMDILHHTLLSLSGEAQRLAQVSAVQAGAAEENLEDYGSLALQSVLQLKELHVVFAWMLSIELLVATRAIRLTDVRLGSALGELTNEVEQVTAGQLTPSEQLQALMKWMPSESAQSVVC